MPIKLIPPRKGKTPYWYGKGTYLGVFVERSTKTDRKSVAWRIIEQWEREIERGVFSTGREETFLSAAVAYLNAGGQPRFVARLIEHFGEKPLRQIDQAEIDAAAVAIFPHGDDYAFDLGPLMRYRPNMARFTVRIIDARTW